jgi:hypothetical protein
MLALALNIGLAVCCAGLLVWNLRLCRRVRVLDLAMGMFAEAIVAAAFSGVAVDIDGLIRPDQSDARPVVH